LEKSFQLKNNMNIALIADVFNIINDDSHEDLVSSDSNSSAFLTPDDFVQPRRVQLGAKFRF